MDAIRSRCAAEAKPSIVDYCQEMCDTDCLKISTELVVLTDSTPDQECIDKNANFYYASGVLDGNCGPAPQVAAEALIGGVSGCAEFRTKGMAYCRAYVDYDAVAPTEPTSNPCPGPVGGDVTFPNMTSLLQFTIEQDEPTTGTCTWSASDAGLEQTSNAWGNYPDYNTLMGCNAVFNVRAFSEFILEVDVDATRDNDGIGLLFGWQDPSAAHPEPGGPGHLRAILMNDGSPNPAADGVGGPFAKIKVRNERPCLGEMSPAQNCFDTLAFLTNDGQADLVAREYNDPNWGPTNFNHASGLNSWPHALPAPFAQE